MARQAVERFQASKMPDNEADARNTLARSLILEGKLADAQREIESAAKLAAQDRIVRISMAITGARLKARTGRQVEARQDLDSLLKEAKEKNLVGLQLEVRLALAEFDSLGDSKGKSSSAKSSNRTPEIQAIFWLQVRRDVCRLPARNKQLEREAGSGG